jgi:PAN domain
MQRSCIVCRLGAVAVGMLMTTAHAEIVPWQQLYVGITMTQAQCAAIPDAVWVTPQGRAFCMRYYLSTAGGQGKQPVVFFSGDAPWASLADREPNPPTDQHFNDLNTDLLPKRADQMSRQLGTTAILFARVGLDGSSGVHHTMRHTMLELLATNAALDAIKQRYGFEGFNLYGHSGGGNLAAGLLELRTDIGCDIPADGQLTKPNPHGLKLETGPSADPAHQVFDVTDAVATIARNKAARILVVTDPQDQIVRIEHQNPFVVKLRQAGGKVDQFFVDSGGPEHHFTDSYAEVVMRDCLWGANHDEIAFDLSPRAGSVLNGVNFKGADYAEMQLDSSDPLECQKVCRADGSCLAWTYVKPALQGNLPRCWLKSRLPAQTYDACCTSGVERKPQGP